MTAKRKSSHVAAAFVAPMKALGVAQAPPGIWHCEVKYDGYRAVAVINRGHAELWSRNRKVMSPDYPEIVAGLQKLRCRAAVLDGEIVALDEKGRSRFQLLQNRGRAAKRPTLVYYLFDLLARDGKSLLQLPWEERRVKLGTLCRGAPPPLQLSPVFDVEPHELLLAARRQGLEGIIAKHPKSAYEADRRSGAWVKCKVIAEQEFVIGGFTLPRRSRQHFGAILVGYYRRGKLLYAGKVGTGFDRAYLASLHAQFRRRQTKACPFANLPMNGRPRFGQGMTASVMRSVGWLTPDLVAQIKFSEWTREGLLRQPVFLGLRTDKTAKGVRREAGAV